MTPESPIKLVSQLLDLPLVDSDGQYSGIVDDVEFSGSVGKTLKLESLLVGPGAYSKRLPRWAMVLVRLLSGDRIVRVPWTRVKRVSSTVHLDCRGAQLGLGKSEERAARWLPLGGAL